MATLVKINDDIKAVTAQMAQLEKELADLRTAAKVIAKYEGPPVASTVNPAPAMELPARKMSIKGAIFVEVKQKPGITKDGVVTNLLAKGIEANPSTVGTTLSKSLGKELEKLGEGYRLKGESPVAAGLSSATESDGS